MMIQFSLLSLPIQALILFISEKVLHSIFIIQFIPAIVHSAAERNVSKYSI